MEQIQNENKGISKKTIFIILAILVAILAGYFFISGNVTGNVSSEDVQKITLSYQDYNYYPNTITVKQGVPVEITLDSSIRGCFRSFTIRDLGINQYSATPAQTIKFTPTQKGTFIFACSMHMGTGTIIVE